MQSYFITVSPPPRGTFSSQHPNETSGAYFRKVLSVLTRYCDVTRNAGIVTSSSPIVLARTNYHWQLHKELDWNAIILSRWLWSHRVTLRPFSSIIIKSFKFDGNHSCSYWVNELELETLHLIKIHFTKWYAYHGPLTRYAKLRVEHAPGMPGTFSPSPTSEETAS